MPCFDVAYSAKQRVCAYTRNKVCLLWDWHVSSDSMS